MLDYEHYMKLCLDLAAKAAGRTAPNPLVGAVIVSQEGEVVASGYHRAAGQPHAEVEALDQAGSAALGGTLVVNLEPCCHFGNTPPCADRIIESGVRRVVAGISDPNPAVAGGGIKVLQDAGIEVIVGVLEQDCRYLNRGFLKWISSRRPWLCLKIASTLDGCIADRNGGSRWISGKEAREHVHFLRNTFDCVMVGGATAQADDPELTVKGIVNSRDPLRAIIDPWLRLSPQARVCAQSSFDGATVVFARQEAIEGRKALFPAQVQLVPCSLSAEDKLDLGEILSWLGERRILTVLCEGGGRLAAALLQENLVDEVQWIVAPRLLVDGQAVRSISGSRQRLINEALELRDLSVSPLGQDILVRGRLSEIR